MDLSDPFIRRKAEKSVDWKVTSRLNGDLSVSRAIGDACYKVSLSLRRMVLLAQW